MRISQFIVNPFAENTYILWTGVGGDAIIVDPGMCDEDEQNTVNEFLDKNNLALQKVILTHQHADHILSAQYISSRYNVPVFANSKDNVLGERLQEQANMFGLNCRRKPLCVANNLEDGDDIELGEEKIIVLAVPGHSQGGLAYYIKDSGCVLVGDSLFAQSIGRTDLPGGDYDQLINSIKIKLLSLPDETVVYPGHGGATTIGDEKMYNPYIRISRI